jgi:hypothetical protein
VYTTGVLSVYVDDLESLPEAAKTILAYCLDKDDPSLGTLLSEESIKDLQQLGWLDEDASPIPGTRQFHIPALRWRQLKGLKSQLLTPQRLLELSRTRSLGSSYPRFW